MRYALLSDVHANLPAMEAVLADVASQSVTSGMACSLPPEALIDRIGWISALNRDHLRACRLERTTLQLTYDAAASREVRALVASEQECCRFLRFAIQESQKEIELRIDVPTNDEMNVGLLFAPFLIGAPEAAKAAR